MKRRVRAGILAAGLALTLALAGLQGGTAAALAADSDPSTSIAGGAIAGTPRVGYPLSFAYTAATPSDATLTYRWSRFQDEARTLSTSSGYTPTRQDAHDGLKLTVTAAADGFTTTSTTYWSAGVLPATMAPAAYVGSSPVVGVPDSVDDDFWDPTPTTRSYQWKVDKHAVSGATSASFTPRTADVGKRLSVTETGSRDGFGTARFTATAYYPVRQKFSHVPTPTITGTAMVGSVLTAHTSAWKPAAKSYTYTWYVGQAAEGTGRTFTPFDDSDAGQVVTVVITGESPKAGPTSSPHSVATAPIARGQVTAGTVGIRGALSNEYACADLKGWAQTQYWMTYTWYLNGNVVSDGPAGCYRLPMGTEGQSLAVIAGQDFPDSAAVLATSKTYTVGRGAYIASTRGVQIVGDIRVGGTVSIDESYWSPAPTRFVVTWYTWSIYGPHRIASGPTLTIPSKDRGKQLMAKVVGSGPLLNTGSQSTQFFVIGRGHFVAPPTPTVSGTVAVGSVVRAHRGTWSPSHGTTFRYQWYRQADPASHAVAIVGATKSTYRVSASSLGDLLSVRVTASKKNYSTASVSSHTTAAVVATAL